MKDYFLLILKKFKNIKYFWNKSLVLLNLLLVDYNFANDI